MLPIVAALVCSLPSLHVMAQDTPVLRRLEHALSDISDKKAWFVRFERQCPPSDIPDWRRLQRRAAPNSKQYSELSFALAYYGKNYKTNLLGVTRPYRFYHISFAAYKQEYYGKKDYDHNWDKNWTGYGSTWFALNLLYLKHHDLTSLSFWLDQSLDGGPADFNDDELGELWKRHKIDMLRATAGSPLRITNMAEMLLYNNYHSGSVRRLLREMRGLSQSNDTRIRTAARQVAAQVQSHVKDIDDFDEGQREDSKKVGQSGTGRTFAVCRTLNAVTSDLSPIIRTRMAYATRRSNRHSVTCPAERRSVRPPPSPARARPGLPCRG